MLTPVVVVAVAVSLLFPAARHQWALSIFRQPARYTALSFNYAWALPSNATSDSPIPVSFTIANREGRDLDYRYVLREVDQLGVSRTLGAAARMITSGGNWTVSTSVRPTCRLQPCRIDVVLPGHKESLYFLVFLKVPPHKPKPKSRFHSHRHHSRPK